MGRENFFLRDRFRGCGYAAQGSSQAELCKLVSYFGYLLGLEATDELS
jgi:hypothetical protein